MTKLEDGVTIYFLRHGETDWNAQLRYQGQIDIPLNARGRAQAARNGRELRLLLGDRLASLDHVASPLSRAAETMRIARSEAGLDADEFRRDPRLMEQHYGHWEGELWSELPHLDPQGFTARQRDKWGWQPRGGESYAMLSRRIAGWLAEVRRDCVVASHGAVSRVLRGLLLPIPTAEQPDLPVPQDRILVLRRDHMEWV